MRSGRSRQCSLSGLSSFGEECSVAQYVKAPGLESFRVEHGALADDNLINGAVAFVRFKQIRGGAVCFKPWRKAVGEAFGRSQIGMVARISTDRGIGLGKRAAPARKRSPCFAKLYCFWRPLCL